MRLFGPALSGLVLAWAIASIASVGAAQDRPRCAVMPLDGSGSVVVRRSLMRALEEHGGVSVVPEGEVDRVTGSSPGDVARRTSAGIVLTGAVTGRGARRILTLDALDAGGRTLAHAEIRLRTGGAGRRALNDGVADLLAAALAGVGSSSRRAEPAESDDVRAAEPEPPVDAGRFAGEYGVAPPVFSVRLGVVLRTRDAEAVLLRGLPRSWRSDPAYAELWAGLELRPLARSSDMWRGLFLRGEVAVAAGLGSRDTAGASVATDFFRVSGDLGYLVPVGDVLEVGAALGVRYDAYQLGVNMLYPSVELASVRPGVRVRIRALGEMLVVSAELGYRGVVSRSELGASFGPDGGDSHGVDFSGGISGSIELGDDVGGLCYSLEASWVGVWHTFAGVGSLGEAERGTEEGLRVLVSAGWAI